RHRAGAVPPLGERGGADHDDLVVLVLHLVVQDRAPEPGEALGVGAVDRELGELTGHVGASRSSGGAGQGRVRGAPAGGAAGPPCPSVPENRSTVPSVYRIPARVRGGGPLGTAAPHRFHRSSATPSPPARRGGPALRRRLRPCRRRSWRRGPPPTGRPTPRCSGCRRRPPPG